MTDAKFAKLVKLEDTTETVADWRSDVRGSQVIDKDGYPLGKVEALLVDEREKKVRFLEVASGGFVGIGQVKSFIPIDAITRVTGNEVHIDQTAGHVADAPVYDPKLVNQSAFYKDTYGYYGMLPFWGSNYIYPSYPGRDPLDKN